MFKMKYLIISLLFLIIAIGAISHVSASDLDAVNDVVSEDSSVEEISTEEVSAEQSSAEEIKENDLMSSDLNNNEVISQDSNTDIIAEDNTETPTDNQSSESEEAVVQPTVKKVKISAAKLTTIYKSTKKFKVKVLDSDKKAVSGLKLKIKVYTGKKFKTYSVKTNSKGIATLKVSALKLGKHKVVITTNNPLFTGKASSLIKINPRPVSMKVVSIKNKEFAALYVTVKDKTLKKYVDKVPVKLLIYTGKKYKTLKLATSYDKDEKQHGAITYLTNSLSVGKHKVKLVAYGKYKGTKTSKLTILKSAKKNVPVYAYSKNGKIVVYVKYKGQWIKA